MARQSKGGGRGLRIPTLSPGPSYDATEPAASPGAPKAMNLIACYGSHTHLLVLAFPTLESAPWSARGNWKDTRRECGSGRVGWDQGRSLHWSLSRAINIIACSTCCRNATRPMVGWMCVPPASASAHRCLPCDVFLRGCPSPGAHRTTGRHIGPTEGGTHDA
jgi:hypothetical protein